MADVAPWAAAGLTDLDAAVYKILLREGRPVPIADVATLAGCDPRQVPPVLEDLHRAGLAAVGAGVIRVVHADLATAAVLDAAYARLEEHTRAVAALQHELRDLARVEEDRALLRDRKEVLVVEGITAIEQQLAELATCARTEYLCIVGTSLGDLVPTSRPLLDVNRGMSDRGVKMRTILPDAIADNAATWAYAEELAALGDDVRTVPTVPMIVNIADRSAAMVPLDLDRTKAGALLVRNATLVGGLVSLFEVLWRGALPLHSPRPRSDISEEDRRLLALLARGAKDEQVARVQSVSVRTVRARVAALMTALGARSRFQLATLAAQRGWLPAPTSSSEPPA